MITQDVISFFETVLKSVYDKGTILTNYINDGAYELCYGESLYEKYGENEYLSIYTGSEKACIIFDAPHPLFNQYVVKFNLDIKNNATYTQCDAELYNYNYIKDYDFNSVFSAIERGRELRDILGEEWIGYHNYLYVAERADIDKSRYISIACDYISKNLNYYMNNCLTEYERNYLIEFYSDDNDEMSYKVFRFMPLRETFECVLEELGYNNLLNNFNFYQVLDTIGDLHEANIGFINEKIKIIDYGLTEVG